MPITPKAVTQIAPDQIAPALVASKLSTTIWEEFWFSQATTDLGHNYLDAAAIAMVAWYLKEF